MQWLVGMDLGDRGQGALGYARWLSASLRDDRFEGVHVLEEAVLRQMLRYHHLAELEEQAATLAEKVVEQAGARDVLSERRVLCGRTAEQTLTELGHADDVRALVIGRQARRGENRIVRLGRVARRVLRALPCPVVVVPPDLRSTEVGDGPIVLATNAEEDAAGAVRFAQQLSADLGRPLSVVHVVASDEGLSAELMPSGALFRELREEHERRLVAWMRAHGLVGVPYDIREGSVIDRIDELAKAKHAPLLVCGSRGLGLGLRLFSSSVATDLAATCEVPIAVVPNARRGTDDESTAATRQRA